MDQFNIKKDESNKFLRSIIKEDVKYRKIKCMKFEDELKTVLDENCELCFHGTTIWNTEKILKSGNISAEIDRVEASENVLNNPGNIHVSTIKNLWFTVKHHADLLNFKYPAGCIFVIMPKNAEDIQSSKNKNLIENVNFKTNPERLIAIITTPENINRVKTWIAESGLSLNPSLVVDYEEFISIAEKFKKQSAETIFTN